VSDADVAASAEADGMKFYPVAAGITVSGIARATGIFLFELITNCDQFPESPRSPVSPVSFHRARRNHGPHCSEQPVGDRDGRLHRAGVQAPFGRRYRFRTLVREVKQQPESANAAAQTSCCGRPLLGHTGQWLSDKEIIGASDLSVRSRKN